MDDTGETLTERQKMLGGHLCDATDPSRGRLSQTAYKVLGQSQGVSLLDISLLSGRKHQIRVHLAENDLPIIGDTKYGQRDPHARRLALHAKSLAFNHPHTGQPSFFETRIPHLFSRIPTQG